MCIPFLFLFFHVELGNILMACIYKCLKLVIWTSGGLELLCTLVMVAHEPLAMALDKLFHFVGGFVDERFAGSGLASSAPVQEWWFTPVWCVSPAGDENP